jgi:glycine/D-amino acid oxidase-like deaminating enzyme
MTYKSTGIKIDLTIGEPMSISFWQDHNSNNSNPTTIDFDIVVIGAGIAGLSSAYWLLQENPNSKVAVVDKSELGDAASGRNAGFITCGSVEHFNRLVTTHGEKKARLIWSFSEKNLELIEERIIRPAQDELFFEQNGSFSLASTHSEFEELKTSFNIMKTFNIDVEILQEHDIKTRLGAHGFIGGIKYKKDASINPMCLLRELLKKLKTYKNFKLFENHEVFSIETVGEKKLLKTKKNYFHADALVLATNAYSALLSPYFKDKILPTRGQILTTSPVALFMEGPCYANFVLDYFRQLPSGELIIGGFRQLQKESETGYSDETSLLIQQALEEFLSTHIPKVKDAQITHRWSGIMGFSSDGDPMIGSLPSDSQVYFLGGFTAHGLGLAFHAGKCLTDLIYGREIPDFISARRF